MNQINSTKEDVIGLKCELEELLKLAGDKSSNGLNKFLDQNIYFLEGYLKKLEVGNYPQFVMDAFENPIIFKRLAEQRQSLVDSLNEKNTAKDEIRQKIFEIERVFVELAERLKDDAMFETFLKVFSALQDYKTNPIGINVEISDNIDKVHFEIEGFKEAYLSFNSNFNYPILKAIDENDNSIHMKIIEEQNSFTCDIHNQDSRVGWLGSHLWNSWGYGKISRILGNLRTGIHNLAVLRHPEIANEIPLTFEQRVIMKTNIFRYPASPEVLLELEKLQLQKQNNGVSK